MTTMRVIAKAGPYTVIQDANSVVSIQNGSGIHICDYGSAYEAIREVVKDPAIRQELLNQWANDMGRQSDGRI